MLVLRPVLEDLPREIVARTLQSVLEVLCPLRIGELVELESGELDQADERMIRRQQTTIRHASLERLDVFAAADLVVLIEVQKRRHVWGDVRVPDVARQTVRGHRSQVGLRDPECVSVLGFRARRDGGRRALGIRKRGAGPPNGLEALGRRVGAALEYLSQLVE